MSIQNASMAATPDNKLFVEFRPGGKLYVEIVIGKDEHTQVFSSHGRTWLMVDHDGALLSVPLECVKSYEGPPEASNAKQKAFRGGDMVCFVEDISEYPEQWKVQAVCKDRMWIKTSAGGRIRHTVAAFDEVRHATDSE